MTRAKIVRFTQVADDRFLTGLNETSAHRILGERETRLRELFRGSEIRPETVRPVVFPPDRSAGGTNIRQWRQDYTITAALTRNEIAGRINLVNAVHLHWSRP